jgi:outer membrane murein-binding lipoprotein Lpp
MKYSFYKAETKMKTLNQVETLAKLNDISKSRLKYFKKLHVFKGDNVQFNPLSFEAHSYKWYSFTKLIGGKLVFNDYSYSPTTSKHLSKVKELLSQLGIKIDTFIQAPKGLDSLNSAVSYYETRIKALQAEIDAPRSQAGKNSQRQDEIAGYYTKIVEVKELMQLQK